MLAVLFLFCNRLGYLKMTRPNSPNLARNKKSGNNPTSPNKADTGDLSRFSGEKNAVRQNTGRLMHFVTNLLERFLTCHIKIRTF